MTSSMTVKASDGSGSFSVYMARPIEPNGSTVIAIQEIFGINENMKAICDDLAADGYLALCPDLFWRLEPGLDLDPSIESDLTRAFDLFGQFDINKGIEDIAATIAAARADGAHKVGAVGYCLGGRLAYLTAARTDIDASVAYYGVAIDSMLDEAPAIKKPLLMHIATLDEFVPADAQKIIHAGLDDHPLITLHDYDGADHGFARLGSDHFHAGHAATANARSQIFLGQHVRA